MGNRNSIFDTNRDGGRKGLNLRGPQWGRGEERENLLCDLGSELNDYHMREREKEGERKKEGLTRTKRTKGRTNKLTKNFPLQRGPLSDGRFDTKRYTVISPLSGQLTVYRKSATEIPLHRQLKAKHPPTPIYSVTLVSSFYSGALAPERVNHYQVDFHL